MPSDTVLQMCSTDETITAAMAADPRQPVAKAVKGLFKGSAAPQTGSTDSDQASALDKAAQCGKFPYRPSELFLQIYDDVLSTLDNDPLAGIVSPSLLGSSGVIALSVVSVIPDIIRHYAELVVRARSEIFLATNYWEPSNSASLISDSLRELSKRTQARGGNKIVVKLMYDRGTPSQVIKNHAIVPSKDWSKVGLPHPEEMPYVDLEVVNYHRPPLGTFHAKYLIVDRKVACIDSNNVQDRPNVEMMVHLEGPIVDSFYDMALWSWSAAMSPPLPLLSGPSAHRDSYQFNRDNEYLRYIDPDAAAIISRKFVQKHNELAEKASSAQDQQDEGWYRGWAAKVGWTTGPDDDKSVPEEEHLIGEHPQMKVPTADESKKHDEGDGRKVDDAAVVNSSNAPQHQRDDAKSAQPAGTDVTDASKVDSQESLATAIAQHLNAGNMDLRATAADDETLAEFRPHILHARHDPVPIAMVNRPPIGSPGHNHVHNMPQDVAWLGAFKYARQSIFIQTPTFNASPVIPATLDACRRGIQVTLYLDLGFNDQGEMIPFQGGTNEEVVNKMYKVLNEEGHQDNLMVYWYTSKDQTRPLSAAAKKRNCHVKFMAIDDQVAILGNGNQDTQSWFHSQEINVMVDSKQLVAEWIKGINANQNTFRYGKVDSKDGVWRDSDGTVVEATGIKSTSMVGRMKGFGGAIARVRGTGGF